MNDLFSNVLECSCTAAQASTAHLAIRKSAGALDNEAGGGEVQMVPDCQHGKVGAAQFRRNGEWKPFWRQTFLLREHCTDTITITKICFYIMTGTFCSELRTEQGSGEFSLTFSLLLRYVHCDLELEAANF